MALVFPADTEAHQLQNPVESSLLSDCVVPYRRQIVRCLYHVEENTLLMLAPTLATGQVNVECWRQCTALDLSVGRSPALSSHLMNRRLVCYLVADGG